MGSDRTQEVARQIASLSIRVEESRLENQAENMGRLGPIKILRKVDLAVNSIYVYKDS